MKPANLISRLAPTPSGHLHLGNIANFWLTAKLVKEASGTLALRIDDCDGTRARREFVEHIFDTLTWLGIGWQAGPKNTEDFYANFSQVARKEYYFEKLKALKEKVFACACSRKALAETHCRCRDKKISFLPGEHALRLVVTDEPLRREFGDVVLWRKDDGPAYQWASVIDDLDANTSLIVRGVDLKSSSDLQRYIAELVRPGGFGAVKFIHHPLLTDESGAKLAKSRGSLSVTEMRSRGAGPESVLERVRAAVKNWGY